MSVTLATDCYIYSPSDQERLDVHDPALLRLLEVSCGYYRINNLYHDILYLNIFKLLNSFLKTKADNN